MTILQPLHLPLHILINHFQSSITNSSTHNIFRGRIDDDFIHLLDGALTFCIKTSYRIDFIAPKLQAIRTFICQIIYIKDTASDRKLSRTFYLTDSLKPHGCQLSAQCFQYIFRPKNQTIFCNLFQRKQSVKKSIYGSDHRHRFAFQHSLDNSHSLADDQITVNVRIVENNIFGRIVKNIPVKELIIRIYFFCLDFVISHNQLHWIRFTDTADEMAFLRIDTAVYMNRRPMSGQIADNLLIFT